MTGLARVLALGLAAGLLLGGCDSGAEPAETGGLATTTPPTVEAPTELNGPLDELAAERVGDLELGAAQGDGQVREAGAADARVLDYLQSTPDGGGALVTLALWPAAERARAYNRKTVQVLSTEQGFELAGKGEAFDGRRGEGVLFRLSDGEGTEAAVWSSGRLSVYVLADAAPLETLIDEAPFGRATR